MLLVEPSLLAVSFGGAPSGLVVVALEVVPHQDAEMPQLVESRLTLKELLELPQANHLHLGQVLLGSHLCR